MFGKASKSLANKLVKKNIIAKEDFEVYQFGMETFLMKAFHIISYLVIGAVFFRLPELLVFLAAFIPLRESSGGYHAGTALKCYVMSCATVISFLCFLVFLPDSMMEYSLVLALAASLFLFLIVPVETGNKPLEDAERTYYKSKAGFIIIIEFGLVLIFRMVEWKELSFILALSLGYELVIALAGFYVNRTIPGCKHVE
ncbi:accessory gene regulator B family protein [Anaerocolumna sp. AGMB13025]|uniref:accessory gene regulator ArgB-like protein n=1 Tax=Anaerocolumna sp. AGMB13025 TaxID=3039116 RepID=UPI00241E1FBB|nr:accessory gene regulator B family protein [Anaerocolumna sp. AGMB13025]WFR59865.1 accessory gene regulator B family protein [Anaerocolumna sp. AGMB13025]